MGVRVSQGEGKGWVREHSPLVTQGYITNSETYKYNSSVQHVSVEVRELGLRSGNKGKLGIVLGG